MENISHLLIICDTVCNLVSFVQFKKREKHTLRSVTFSKVIGFNVNNKNTRTTSVTLKTATLLKVTLLHGCFSRFLNCTKSTKSRQKSHVNI